MQKTKIRYQDSNLAIDSWMKNVIKEDEISRFMHNGDDFINDEEIERVLEENKNPSESKVRDIIQKSLSIQRLEPDETATLLNVEDEDLWKEIFEIAGKIKET